MGALSSRTIWDQGQKTLKHLVVKIWNNNIGKICYCLQDLMVFYKLWGHYLQERFGTKDKIHSSTSSGKIWNNNIGKICYYLKELMVFYMQSGIIISNDLGSKD